MIAHLSQTLTHPYDLSSTPVGNKGPADCSHVAALSPSPLLATLCSHLVKSYRGNTTDSHSLLGGTNLCLLNNLCPAHGECFNIKEDIGVSPVQ